MRVEGYGSSVELSLLRGKSAPTPQFSTLKTSTVNADGALGVYRRRAVGNARDVELNEVAREQPPRDVEVDQLPVHRLGEGGVGLDP